MKSVLLSTPGRCGTHWLARILRKALGLEQQKTKRWFEMATWTASPGNLHITHDPMSYCLPVMGEVDFVVMVRDPRDIVVSAAHYWCAQHELGNHGSVERTRERSPHLPATVSFDAALTALKAHGHNAEWWKQYLLFRDAIPHHVVRYEDLHESPYETIRQLLVNMARPQPEKIIRKALEQSAFEKVSGGRHTGEEDSLHFYRKGIVGDWKNYFTDEEEAAFSQRFATQMYAFDYKDFDYRSRHQIDPECTRLVDALNLVPGIRTFESCCGHGRQRFWVFCVVESIESLPFLAFHLGGRQHHGKWHVTLDGGTPTGKGHKPDGSNANTVFLTVRGPVGEKAYLDAGELAAILEEKYR